MTALAPARRVRERGFSLVEILVGVLIGMIGIVVIFQMMAAADARKRSTGSGTDAQIIGALALHSLERDVREAGYGFSTASYMGCTVNAYDSVRTGGGAYTFTLAPVQIAQGASGAPDTIVTLWGNSALFAATQTFDSSSATSKHTQGRAGIQNGDIVLAAGSGPICALVEITGTANADGVTIDHTTGSYVNAGGSTVNARHNPAAGPPVSFSSGNLYDLGNGPRRNIWSIRGNRTLTMSNDLVYTDADGDGANDWLEVATGVIDMQADYGVDANNDNMISSGEWTTSDPADWSKVRAIRVGLLMRSAEYERTQVTTTAPSWMGGTFTMKNVDGTADTNPTSDNNWRNYRYRVYQTIIPLRNMIWGTAP
jgi:type IV pilus assembly protein PilW